jgi:hypothetical protein
VKAPALDLILTLVMSCMAAWVLAADQTPDPPPDGRTIIELAATQPGGRVRFTEQRLNTLLSEPLVFEGYVAMTADGTLTRVVERPFEEKASIDGEQATLERDGKVRRVDLDRRGRGGVYLRTLYALLRGDADALENSFDLEVSGDRDNWQLTLTPAERALGRWLERIVVSGSGEVVERIRMERSNGAWQDMRLLRDPP